MRDGVCWRVCEIECAGKYVRWSVLESMWDGVCWRVCEMECAGEERDEASAQSAEQASYFLSSFLSAMITPVCRPSVPWTVSMVSPVPVACILESVDWVSSWSFHASREVNNSHPDPPVLYNLMQGLALFFLPHFPTSHIQYLSLSLSFISLSNTHTLSLSLSLSHTHTQTNTHLLPSLHFITYLHQFHYFWIDNITSSKNLLLSTLLCLMCGLLVWNNRALELFIFGTKHFIWQRAFRKYSDPFTFFTY